MEHIRTARDGGVGLITIDRRERFNALSVPGGLPTWRCSGAG
jgi:hypothetical protein